MKGVTFGQVRAARRVLNMKRTVAASLLGMSYQQLSKGEAVNSAVPSSNVQSAGELIALAQRVRRRPAGLGNVGRPSRLPFERPRCVHCTCTLHVTATNYSPRRGEFWYFNCPGCGRRYWSSDGRPRPVQPKGGAWRDFKDRVRCPSCQVDSRASGSRSRRNDSRIWHCPQCHKRYLNLHGHAVESIPGRRAFLPLPFLKSRECPLCGSVRLVIRARPHAPKIRHFYFRCGACARTFRFDKKLGRLILLQARQVARIKR